MKMKTAVQMKADKKIGCLYLYDDIAPDSYDYWNGKTIESSTSATTVAKALADMGDISELNVYICSRGGDVATGNAIYSQLCRVDVPKTAYIDGLAASIATVIPCACDKVIMYSTGVYMIHNASACIYGNAIQLREYADVLDTYSAAARQAYVSRCSISEEEIQALMDSETHMTAEEALKFGFIDEIADKPAMSGDSSPKGYMQAVMRLSEQSGGANEIKAISDRLDRIEAVLQSAEKCFDKKEDMSKAESAPKAENAPESGADKAEMLKAFLSAVVG